MSNNVYGVCGSTGSISVALGYNNISTGYNNIAIGHNSTSGGGVPGLSGIITNWKDDVMKKYHMRFTIKSEYDVMTFAPLFTIIDTNNFNEYKIKPKGIPGIHIEVDEYIQKLIIDIREEKITNILK